MSDLMSIEKFYAPFDEQDIKWFNEYRLDWQSDDQWLCNLFLQRIFKGFHHIPAQTKPYGSGIEINFKPCYMSTFDNSMLTNLVILSHDWGIRSEIKGSGCGLIKLCLWKRKNRDGDIYERHPTIEQAIINFR